MGCVGGECKSTTGAAAGGAMGDNTWHKASEASGNGCSYITVEARRL